MTDDSEATRFSATPDSVRVMVRTRDAVATGTILVARRGCHVVRVGGPATLVATPVR